MWIAELHLSFQDKEELLDDSSMLTDIQAAQGLLKRQFPELKGLQCSLLSQTDDLEPVSEYNIIHKFLIIIT